jgi:hypothetical protein
MNDAEKKKWILKNWNTLSPAKIKESLNRYWSKETPVRFESTLDVDIVKEAEKIFNEK